MHYGRRGVAGFVAGNLMGLGANYILLNLSTFWDDEWSLVYLCHQSLNLVNNFIAFIIIDCCCSRKKNSNRISDNIEFFSPALEPEKSLYERLNTQKILLLSCFFIAGPFGAFFETLTADLDGSPLVRLTVGTLVSNIAFTFFIIGGRILSAFYRGPDSNPQSPLMPNGALIKPANRQSQLGMAVLVDSAIITPEATPDPKEDSRRTNFSTVPLLMSGSLIRN